jgi:hypothetical protein
MNEPLTPEPARVKAIAELMAMPGPKPLKPIPPDVKAGVLAEFELESEGEVARQVEELRRTGGIPIEPLLAELRRRVGPNRRTGRFRPSLCRV